MERERRSFSAGTRPSLLISITLIYDHFVKLTPFGSMAYVLNHAQFTPIRLYKPIIHCQLPSWHDWNTILVIGIYIPLTILILIENEEASPLDMCLLVRFLHHNALIYLQSSKQVIPYTVVMS